MARIDYGDGMIYEGGTLMSDGEQVPHGFGVYTFTKEKAFYRGQFYYGEYHGEGEMHYTHDPNDKEDHIILKKGTFKNDYFVKGIIVFESGATIEGEYDTKRNVIGKAKYTLPNGDYFIERIKVVNKVYSVDIYQGTHILYSADGSKKYEGYFGNGGLYDSVGTLYFKNGSYYHGIFKNGEFHDVGHYYRCINKEKELYLEFITKCKEGKLLKADIVFDKDHSISVGKAQSGDEACAKASQASIKQFLELPKDTDAFTKNYATAEKVIRKLFSDRPKVMETLLDIYAFHFMEHRFRSRLKYVNGELSYDYKLNKKIHLQWYYLYRAAREYKDISFVELLGSEKEADSIFKTIKYDPLYQQSFVPYTIGDNRYQMDDKTLPPKKKEIAPSLQGKEQPYYYPNRDLMLLKKKASKGLIMKFVLSKWGYVIKDMGSCNDEDLIIPPYDDNVRFDVKVIDKKAFYLKGIVSVQLPDFITVEEHAFYRCTNLKTIYLERFTKVKATAFECLFNLEQIVYHGTKKDWNLYQGCEEWIHYINSNYKVVVRCADGNLLIED